VSPSKDHTPIERSGPAPAASARPDTHARCHSLDDIAEADLLVDQEPRQSDSMELIDR
jgi:hypothetical protein